MKKSHKIEIPSSSTKTTKKNMKKKVKKNQIQMRIIEAIT